MEKTYIKVKELIKQLNEVDPNAIVVVTTDNFEQGNCDVPARGITEFNGNFVNETFRDAFDGENYTKEVIKYTPMGGKQKFIKIA